MSWKPPVVRLVVFVPSRLDLHSTFLIEKGRRSRRNLLGAIPPTPTGITARIGTNGTSLRVPPGKQVVCLLLVGSVLVDSSGLLEEIHPS